MAGPGQLSSCLFSCVRLKAVAPYVLQMVPAIAAEIPDKALDMTSEDLSNTLLACAKFKDVAADVLMVVVIASQIRLKARQMEEQQQFDCLLSAVQLHGVAPDALGMVVTEVEPDILQEVLWCCIGLLGGRWILSR